MKILVVTQSFFPDVDGGSGRLVFELSRRLRKRGHEVALFGERSSRSQSLTADIDDIRVVRYGNPLIGLLLPWSITSPLLVHGAASNLFRDDHFDLVWCHHYSPGLGGLLFAEQKGIPGLFTYHASRYLEWTSRAGQPRRFNSRTSRFLVRWWADSTYAMAAFRIERKCLEKSARITVLSRFSREQLGSLHPHQAWKVEIIPGGVDTERFRPTFEKNSLRRKLGLPEQGFLILTVRRLIARMGLENLIDAMKTVHEKDPDAHLLIGGQGYLLRSLKERVSRRGLGDRVRLLGYVDDELLPEYYAASDLFVLPTLSLEGFGMVTLEALACGTPVLGSDAGATPEILRDLDPGLILEETEPESLGRAILRRREAARNTKLRAKCRSYVEENYSWEKVTDRFEKTMTEMVNRGRR